MEVKEVTPCRNVPCVSGQAGVNNDHTLGVNVKTGWSHCESINGPCTFRPECYSNHKITKLCVRAKLKSLVKSHTSFSPSGSATIHPLHTRG